MDDCDGRDEDAVVAWNKDIGRKARTVELTQLALICASFAKKFAGTLPQAN